MDLTFEISDQLKGFLDSLLASFGPWWGLAVVFIICLPKIIPAFSAAIAEQRKITHKRDEARRKIENAAAQRANGQSAVKAPSRRGTK